MYLLMPPTNHKNVRLRFENGHVLIFFQQNPERTASLFSRATFSWMSPLLALGSKKWLNLEDLYPISEHFRSDYAFGEFNRHWKKQKMRPK